MLTLPRPDHRPLRNAALPQVVTQVRFDTDVETVAGDSMALVQTELARAGMPHPRLSQVTAGELVVVQGPAPVTAQTPQRRGWRLDTADGDWQLTLLPGSVALETPRFPGFDALATRMAVALEALGQAFNPTVVGRVGLRFVNLLPPLDPGADVRAWCDWVAPALAGLLSDEQLGEGVIGAEQRTIVAVDAEVSATIHSGLVVQPDGPRFLLDIDSYAEPASGWQVESVTQLLDRLNSASVSLFQHLLSDAMLTHLRGDDMAAEGDR